MEKEQVFSKNNVDYETLKNSLQKETEIKNESLLVYRAIRGRELHNLKLGYIGPTQCYNEDGYLKKINTFLNKDENEGLCKYFYFYAEDAYKYASERNNKMRPSTINELGKFSIAEFNIPTEILAKNIGIGAYTDNTLETSKNDYFCLEFSIPEDEIRKICQPNYEKIINSHRNLYEQELEEKGVNWPSRDFSTKYAFKSQFITGRLFETEASLPPETSRKTYSTFKENYQEILKELGMHQIIIPYYNRRLPGFRQFDNNQPFNLERCIKILKNINI